MAKHAHTITGRRLLAAAPAVLGRRGGGQTVMPAPSPRRLASALAVLAALPAPALADLTERLIDRLDALDGDTDAEPDHDGEADQDDEAGTDDDGPWWTPAMGPADCGQVQPAGIS